MLRIASGVTDQFAYFNPGDLGLTTFTVYRSRNGAAAAVMTTPTINETDSTNMPGEYELLLDEDMTIGAGNLTEHMVFYVTHAGMTPQRIEIELFDPSAAILTTAITESYNTDGSAPTVAQALCFIMQMLAEKSVSGTTVTVKKLDGATTAFTLTLNDASTPTSITRAT